MPYNVRMTVTEAASELDVSRQRVWQLIKAGVIPVERFGKSWVVLDLTAAKARNKKPGLRTK